MKKSRGGKVMPTGASSRAVVGDVCGFQSKVASSWKSERVRKASGRRRKHISPGEKFDEAVEAWKRTYRQEKNFAGAMRESGRC